MQGIREEIKSKGLTQDMLSFEEIPVSPVTHQPESVGNAELNESLHYINTRYTIQPYKELAGNPVAVFFKKIMRKLTKFYVEPIVNEQNALNFHVTRSLNELTNAQSQSSELSVVEKKFADMICKQQTEITALTQRIEQLSKENAQLRQSNRVE